MPPIHGSNGPLPSLPGLPPSPLRSRSFVGWGHGGEPAGTGRGRRERGDERAGAARRVQDLRSGAGQGARAWRGGPVSAGRGDGGGDGAERVGQVHAADHRREPGGTHQRGRAGLRHGAGGDAAGAQGPAAAPGDRVRVPGFQPAARADRRRERRAAAGTGRRRGAEGARGRAGRAGSAGRGRPGRLVPRSAVRRRAAAGRDRPRGGRGPPPAAGRRAVRRAGLGERGGGDAAAARGLRAGRGRGRGDPRRAAGRLGRPGGIPARRADQRPDRPAARPRIPPHASRDPVSIALREPPDLAAGAGGIGARRAVIRWGWRLFRREWRQQLLVLGLLTVAVAVTIWGASTVTNVALQNPNYPTFGTAAVQVTLPGSDPHLAADIAAVAGRWGPADVIENQDIANGTTQPVQLRAENPHGHYNSPMLGLVSGTYPAGPGQVALTSQVATLYGVHAGGSWRAAGTTWRVTGIVQNPSNLADEFALVVPGQVTHPSQVIMLLGSRAVQQAIGNGTGTLPDIPAAATVTTPNAVSGGISPAVLVLVVEVLGLVFIGPVSVAGFSVMAQRRLRALGMLSAIGATGRNLRLVMITGGLAVGVTAALAGAVLGLAAWFAYVPTLQQATGHVVDAANVPWWAFGIGVVFAIATSVLASRRPANTMAALPVVAALSGRPAKPKAVRRSALPGVIVFAVGVLCLATAGGLAGVGGNGASPALHLVAGLVAVIVGIVL